MNATEVWIVAVGLAMDCRAVSIARGILRKRFRERPMLTLSFSFGMFQGLIPWIGWTFFYLLSHCVEDSDPWIAFAILLFLGIRMIRQEREDGGDRFLRPGRGEDGGCLIRGNQYGCMGHWGRICLSGYRKYGGHRTGRNYWLCRIFAFSDRFVGRHFIWTALQLSRGSLGRSSFNRYRVQNIS